jgi:hypothetical protein
MYIANDLPSFVSLGPPDQVLCCTPNCRVRFLIRGWTQALLIKKRWDSTKNDVMNDFGIKSHEISENL